jgi:arabinofuranosyltransferase
MKRAKVIAEPPGRTGGTPGWRVSPAWSALLACVILFSIVIVHKAWVSDDAYITFRTVQNFVEGRGLTWNPGERVQVYTHPSWMFLVSLAHLATGELFYTSLGLNLTLAVAAVLLMATRLSSSWQTACLGVAILTASRAFTDYSTSGLENSLTHFLLVLLLVLYRRSPDEPRSLLWFSLVATLCMLTRLDTLLLVLPALLAYVWRTGLRRALWPLAIGVSALLVWKLFSLLYYGFLFPNTAYAKLNTGIPMGDLARQGMHYLVNSAYWDPITLGATLVTIAWTGWQAIRGTDDAARWTLALGVLLSLLYVVRIGGDFMSGRFLTAPLTVSVCLLISRPWRPGLALTAATASLLLLVIPWTSPFRERNYGPEWHAAIDSHGIADERVVYLKEASLRASWGRPTWPSPRILGEVRWLRANWPFDVHADDMRKIGELSPLDGWPPRGRYDENGRAYRRVFVRGAVGFLGYYMGPSAYIVDYHGICDPLLARLPATVPDPILSRLIPRLGHKGWRVGHYYRRLPAGYVRTLATGRNVISDPRLARYYDVMRTITRDPVFDRQRLETLWRFQTGAYDDLLRP